MGNYSGTTALDFAMASWSPWNPAISFPAFTSYTGNNLYLHVFITDSTGTNTGYLMQTITFISWSVWPDWASIYTSIYNAISWEVKNNLNTVTNGNVSSFSGLYFAKLSGSDELGRFTFSTWLDLTDTGVQNFLQYSLPSSITMSQWSIGFNPGTWFIGKAATLKMNLPSVYSWFLNSINKYGFIVKDGSWNITGNDIISNVYTSVCSWLSAFACPLFLDVDHFTQFDIRPLLTSVHITSNAGTWAWSGNTITLSFTWSEAITWVNVSIAWQTANISWWGTSYVAVYTLSSWWTVSTPVPFTIDFRNYGGNSGNQVTGATDGSYVNYYTSEAAALTGLFSITTSSPTKTTTVSLLLQSQSGAAYTISWNITANLTWILVGTTWSRNITLSTWDGVKTIYVQYSSWATQSTLYSGTITLDQTNPTATGSFSIISPTNQNVIVTLTWYSEPLTWINAENHTFTGNSAFVFTFSDLAGNTWSYTATITWIDKTAVTGSISYDPSTATNQNVLASITFNKTGVTVTNNGWATGYIFTATWTFIFTFSDTAGNTGNTTASVTWIDRILPTAEVIYTNTGSNVLAILTWYSESLTWINTVSKLFTGNGTFIFTFSDLAGNTGSQTASVVLTIPWTTTTTWSVNIWWSTATWIAFASTGTLEVLDTDNANNKLTINVSWAVIQASWGTWNGILLAPTSLNSWDSNNATIGEIWLTNTSTTTNTVFLTIKVWSDTDSLSIAGGGYFNVSFVLSAWTVGDSIKLYRSENWTVRTANTPDATCTLDASKICAFRTDHLSYFATVKVTTTSSGGWGGGGWWSYQAPKDICPNGDFSNDEYDGKCGVPSIHSTNEPTITNSPYSSVFNNAYLYAYQIGITTMSTIQTANMEGPVIRAHMAKMMVNYAIKVLNKKINTWVNCEFKDIQNQTSELKNYIKWSCQLGLMGLDSNGVPKTYFIPDKEVTRAEFGTVLSRILYGNTYNTGEPYYKNHLAILKTNSILTNTDPFLKELRGYVMIMLMNAKK